MCAPALLAILAFEHPLLLLAAYAWVGFCAFPVSYLSSDPSISIYLYIQLSAFEHPLLLLGTNAWVGVCAFLVGYISIDPSISV